MVGHWCSCFCRSRLVDDLVAQGHSDVGVDNCSTEKEKNIEPLRESFDDEVHKRFDLEKLDAYDLNVLKGITSGLDIIPHPVAFGSVPRSIDDPVAYPRSEKGQSCSSLAGLLARRLR